MRRGEAFALVLAAILAAPAVAIEWKWYASKDHDLAFLVPSDMKIAEKEAGDWAGIVGVSPDVVLAAYGKKNDDGKLAAIPESVCSLLSLATSAFKHVDSSNAHGLAYSTWYGEGKAHGRERAGIFVITAHNPAKKVSYAFYILSSLDKFARYRKDFETWYRNIHAHGG